MPETEVYLDPESGVVAIGWPGIPGYVFYTERSAGGGQLETRYTIPAGMTRLVAAPVEPKTEPGACASTRTVPLVPRQRPAREQRYAEGA